jgi:hypothetical protein
MKKLIVTTVVALAALAAACSAPTSPKTPKPKFDTVGDTVVDGTCRSGYAIADRSGHRSCVVFQ